MHGEAETEMPLEVEKAWGEEPNLLAGADLGETQAQAEVGGCLWGPARAQPRSNLSGQLGS